MIALNNDVPSEPTGGGGALFERPDNFRSDAKLAARMIALGVVSLEQAEKLLRSGFILASKSAKKGDARSYSACMKIAIECAKLAQAERHKFIDKSLPDLHDHTVQKTTAELLEQPDYVEWLRKREQDSDPRLIRTNGHAGNGKPVDDGPSRNGH